MAQRAKNQVRGRLLGFQVRVFVSPQAAKLRTIGTDIEAAVLAYCTSCPKPSLESGTQDALEVSTIYTSLLSKFALCPPVSCMARHGVQC